MMRKGGIDERLFRVVELGNRLTAVLVHDPKIQQAAASMDVHVGHFSDPASIPGIAHFTEHMLFLGSERFPVEDEYKAFLGKHGGRCNASTSMEHTTYHFSVGADHLEGALHRFSQFFVSPLFLKDAVDRELHAVHNEFSRNIQVDGRREFQLLKHLALPSHPFSKFGTGNMDTLGVTPSSQGVDIRDAMMKFYYTHYSANLMKLVVVGRESLDDLEKMVHTFFSEVPDRKLSPLSTPLEQVFPEDLHQSVIAIVPVRDKRKVSVCWVIPSLREHFQRKSADFLGNLLGYEGSGSILSWLKREGHALSLAAGTMYSTRDFQIFTVSVSLTDNGSMEVVTEAIFQLLDNLREGGASSLPEFFYHELSQIALNSFNYADKESSDVLATTMSRNLQKFPPENALSGSHLYEEYCPDEIMSLLDLLVVGKCWIMSVDPSHAQSADQKEPWYGAEFSRRKFTPSELERWQKPVAVSSKEIHPPPPNEYIASSFDLHAPTNQKPEMQLLEKPSLKLWYMCNTSFRVPKVHMTLRLYSAQVYQSPRSYLCALLLCSVVEEALTEDSYSALLAGMTFEIGASRHGLEVCVNGFDEKVPVLLHKVLNTLLTPQTIDEQGTRFSMLFEKLTKDLDNRRKDQPHAQVKYESRCMVVEKVHRFEECHRVCVEEPVTLQEMEDLRQGLLRSLFVEGLILGNVSSALVEATSAAIQDFLLSDGETKSSEADTYLQRECYLLGAGQHVSRCLQGSNSEDQNCAIEMDFQIGLCTPREYLSLLVLARCINKPFFNRCRTQEQLGYIAWSGIRRWLHLYGFRFVLQSSSHDPHHLEERIEAFLKYFRSEVLESLQANEGEEFHKYVDAAWKERTQRDPKLDSEMDRMWAEVSSKRYCFHKDDLEAELLLQLCPEDIINVFDKHLRHGSPDRRLLVVKIFKKGQGSEAEISDEAHVPDVHSLRSSMTPVSVDPHTYKAWHDFSQ